VAGLIVGVGQVVRGGAAGARGALPVLRGTAIYVVAEQRRRDSRNGTGIRRNHSANGIGERLRPGGGFVVVVRRTRRAAGIAGIGDGVQPVHLIVIVGRGHIARDIVGSRAHAGVQQAVVVIGVRRGISVLFRELLRSHPREAVIEIRAHRQAALI